MQVERSYICRVVCPSCQGLGWIPDPSPVSASAAVVCPACLGTKTQEVKVTEGIT